MKQTQCNVCYFVSGSLGGSIVYVRTEVKITAYHQQQN